MNPCRTVRVLAVSHDAYLYGAERSLLDAVAGLARVGHHVEVCVPRPGALVELLRTHGIRVHCIPFLRWVPSVSRRLPLLVWARFLLLFPFHAIRAARLIRAGGYDVVYTNTVTVLDFAVAARLLGVPHVWHVRESVADNPQLLSPVSDRRLISVVRALSARVVYNSRFLMERYGAVSPGRDVVVYNGFPEPLLPPRLPRREPGRWVLLIAGSMGPHKGLDVLLDALALLPGQLRTRIVLRVAGHTDDAYMAAAIAPRLSRLDAKVEFLGWIAELQEQMLEADLLVSSARVESFGRTLVEAMLAGLPVVATRSGGPQEIVVDGVTGWLVPPDDPGELCRVLAALLQDPERLQAFGRAGRQRALEQFSLAGYVSGVERCLVEAAGSAAGDRKNDGA